MMRINKQKKIILIIILGLLSAIGPFSIDMYLPGFPGIARDLHTTVAHISLSLSSFFIGIFFGQLLYGPLLDRFGRKKPLYIGLSVYILTSAGCVFVQSADTLIMFRLLQALGGCVGMVASRAIVRDMFPVNEIAKIFSMLMLVIAVSPIIAPTVGGYVSSEFGWQYIFVILTIMTILILAAVHFLLPESRKADPDFSLRPKSILENFIFVFKEPQFYTYAFTGAISAAGLYAYISGSPNVFMEIFKVSEKHYGWIFAFIAMGLISSSQINNILLRKFRSEQIIKIALLCQTCIGILLFTATSSGRLGLFGTILLIFIFLSCQGFSFPNSSALSLAPFSRQAGSASALMGALQMGIGAFTSALVSLMSNHTALPMTGIMAGCALVAFCILLIGRRVIRYKSRIEDVEEEAVEMIL